MDMLCMSHDVLESCLNILFAKGEQSWDFLPIPNRKMVCTNSTLQSILPLGPKILPIPPDSASGSLPECRDSRPRNCSLVVPREGDYHFEK